MISIELNKDEQELVESYAKLNSISISDAFKQALLEKIEYEYDIKIANEAYNEWIEDGKKSMPIDKLWSELNL